MYSFGLRCLSLGIGNVNQIINLQIPKNLLFKDRAEIFVYYLLTLTDTISNIQSTELNIITVSSLKFASNDVSFNLTCVNRSRGGTQD